MTLFLRASLILLGALALNGCNTGSRHDNKASTSAGASAPSGAVNVLATAPTTSSSSATATSGSGAAATSGAIAAIGSTLGATASGATVAPGAVAATPGSTSVAAGSTPAAGGSTPAAGGSTPAAGGSTPAAGGAATPSTQAQIFGTIPYDPTTGFNGTLYLSGERFAPGSTIYVEVNGVPTKYLPATFHSSETLGVYVNLTVAADYTFTVIAPDGSTSTPLTFTVKDGGVQRLFGLAAPTLHMVYPPTLDTNFTGTLWLHGDDFNPGCMATVTVQGLPPVILPLNWVNDRLAGLSIATPLAGNVTIQVSNPTFQTSQSLTIPVGQATSTGQPLTPQVNIQGQVASPFLGTVHVIGSDIELGAYAEMRVAGTTGPAIPTPLMRVSSNEAWWTLAYPQVGNYEVRVVNPSGGATTWMPFDVQ